MNFNKIGIIGAGSWGTALGLLLSERGTPILLWGHNPKHVEELKTSRINGSYLPGIVLPPIIQPTTSLEELANADLILFAPPSKAFREVTKQLAGFQLSARTILLSCTKGIEQGSGLRMSEILAEFFAENPIAALSGPSLATELARKMATAVVIGSKNERIAQALQAIFSTNHFRVYTSDDVAGIELGGALKNIFAISAGISDGLGLGDNSKAALVTRSLAELIRFGSALGGRRETFQGLSGIGDLILTCFSGHSRNRSVGEKLGSGKSITDISNSMNMVAEGVPTTLSAYECARNLQINTPIIDEVYSILYKNKSPMDAMKELLSRDPRSEVE